MTKSKRVMRRQILSKLYDHLQDQASMFCSRETFSELSIHEIDGILAFKGDPHLEELRRALDRLEDGTFGKCLSCKSLISQDRLDYDPTQRICSACEQKFIHVTVGQYAHHQVASH